MNKFISNIKVICLSAVLAATSLFGNVADAQGTSTGRKHYIVFHDDYQNIITRVEPSSTNYTFHADDPFFFVTLPISNIGWSTDLLTPEQWSAGTSTPEMTFYDGEKISKYSISLPLTEDLHLYPVTQYGTYIRFDSRGGTPVPFQFVHVGESISQPTGITKRGYRFEGWYTSPEHTQQFDFSWTPSAGDTPREKYAYANWTPSVSSYTIHVWLEKAEHPYRASLEEAKAHMFEDYAFGTIIQKSNGVITGADVSFSNDDKSSDAVINATYLSVGGKSFPVYFYDNANYSYAQALTEDCISEINDGAGVAPDGTTVLNVFYRRLTFEGTFGVITNNNYMGGNPVFDGSYDHPTVTIRDGETFGSAIEREIAAEHLSLSSATIDMFQYQTNLADSPYFGFYKTTGFSGYTTGYNTHFTFGLWEELFNASDMFLSQTASNYIISGTKPSASNYQIITDGFPFYALIAGETKGTVVLHRRFYTQTIAAAKSNAVDERDSHEDSSHNKPIKNPSANYILDELYIVNKPAGTTGTGFNIEDYDGYTFYEVQDVKRDNNGNITDVDFADGPRSGGRYKTYDPSGYELEVFYKRNSYIVDFTSAPGPDVDNATRSLSVLYQDNLSEAAPTTGGNAFVPGVTWYEDTQHIRYTFAGWYDNAAGAGSPVNFSTFEMPSHNVHLYAKWEVQDIIVTFDAGEGTVGPYHSPEIGFSMSSGNIPSNPGNAEPLDQSGHVAFFCWLKDGVMYDFTECLYEDTTLEALYYVNPADPFKITYKSGKGTGDDVVEFADYGYLYNANAGYEPYNYPDYFGTWGLPTGKVFKYWSGSNGEIYDSYEDPDKEIIMTEDVVLTAIYEGGNADIVINREDLNPGESATYTVSSLGEGGMKTYLLSVVLTNTKGVGDIASRKIVDLEPGNYIVEETSWNWAYDKSTPVIDKETKKIDANTGWGSGSVNYDETLEFTFSGDGLSDVSKHGEGYRYNEFKGTPSGDVPEGGSETPGSGGTDL